MQNDKGTESSGTSASATIAAQIALLVVTVAKDTVLQNGEKTLTGNLRTMGRRFFNDGFLSGEKLFKIRPSRGPAHPREDCVILGVPGAAFVEFRKPYGPFPLTFCEGGQHGYASPRTGDTGEGCCLAARVRARISGKS